MDVSSILNSFLDDVCSRYKHTIFANDEPDLYIKADILFLKFQQLFPNAKFKNIGYFMRTVKIICKNKERISTISTRRRNSTDHVIILQSYSNLGDDITPQDIVSDISDFKIKFISDMQIASLLPCPAVVTPSNKPSINPISSSFPLLQSLGINTNFETNKQQLVNIMSELVLLFKKENKPLNFIHRGNDRPGLLVAIPKTKNYDVFDQMERREKWLENALNFINSNHNIDDTLYWLLQYVYKKSPHVVIKLATDIGLVICHKMSDVEAAAMWVESNVSVNAARIILRHLRSKFGVKFQVPFTQITMMSNITGKVMPVFSQFEFHKTNNNEKVSETIKYWTFNPIHLLEQDFVRLLLSVQNQATFGYESKLFQPSKLGVYVIIGADHGGGRSRYLMRVNYLPSSHRRSVKKTDAGTRTVQFAEVLCKKDVHSVQARIAPVVNEAIKELESSMLIAVKFGKHLICKFLPSQSENINTTFTDDNKLSLSYFNDNDRCTITLDLPEDTDLEPSHPVQIWTVIQSFKVVIAGDLSFFATCTGRDGHSHCRCVYCDSSYNMWNDKSSPPPVKMTLSRLHRLAKIRSQSKQPKKLDTKGVVMAPLFQIEPKFYIVPLLHLLIGVVNKLWSSLLLFLDEFVELVSLRECLLKSNIEEGKEDLKVLHDNLDVLTVNKHMACEEFTRTKSIDVKTIIDSFRQQISHNKEKIKKKNTDIRKWKADLESERFKRKGNHAGIDNLLYNILEASNIKRQHFHGGSMNGVCCRRLLDNLDVIFEKIIKVVSDRMNNKQGTTDDDRDKITLILNKFRNLFEVVDLVFYRLRILDPTPEEIENVKKAISVLEYLWNDIELKEGPKLHILFDHTIEQVELFKGIADLVEDFVEKYHQVGKRLDHLVARMSAQSFRQQELVKIRRQWLSNDPLVSKQIHKVLLKRKRNMKPHLLDDPKTKLLSTIKQERKLIKREKTERKPFFDVV